MLSMRYCMKTKKTIAQTVWELAEPLAQSLSYRLWDVEYVKEGADWILRITIDTEKEEGIGIDDCEKMHFAIDPVLDEVDPIEGPYTLEVSSPGVERALTRPEHFEMMLGKKVTARCFTPVNGNRIFTGVLSGADNEKITLETEAGTVELPRKVVSKTETVYDW